MRNHDVMPLYRAYLHLPILLLIKPSSQTRLYAHVESSDAEWITSLCACNDVRVTCTQTWCGGASTCIRIWMMTDHYQDF